MRRAYHVARADLRQRIRSRKLLVALAAIAYVGYLVNVGSIELAYQHHEGSEVTNYHGVNTAAFVGLKAGLTGAAVVMFGGFFLMNDALARDRRYGVDRLVASTPVSDRTYLLGKWLSNVALGVVIVGTLGGATVINHLVHGVGRTDPVPLLAPLVVFAIPLCAVVGAVAVLFETSERLSGTIGTVVYLLGAPFALAGVVAASNGHPTEIPVWARATDVMGHLAVYELTADALLAAVPDYSGGPPSVGTLAGDESIDLAPERVVWPAWIYVQRVGLVLTGLAILGVATATFDRLPVGESTDDSGSRARFARVPIVGRSVDDEGDATVVANATGRTRAANVPDRTAADDASPTPTPVETTDGRTPADPVDEVTTDPSSTTPVETRAAGGFGRVVRSEFDLAVRGQPWWWYAGTAVLILAPLLALATAGPSGAPVGGFRGLALPLAFVWPIFVWSGAGTRAIRHGVLELVLSSRYPLGQLLAAWLAGALVALGVSSGLIVLFLAAGETGALFGIASGTIFVPSFAVAAGSWTRSATLFEVGYLLLWYVGPLNGTTALDFIGSTPESVALGVPLAFLGLGLVLLGAAAVRRRVAAR